MLPHVSETELVIFNPKKKHMGFDLLIVFMLYWRHATKFIRANANMLHNFCRKYAINSKVIKNWNEIQKTWRCIIKFI